MRPEIEIRQNLKHHLEDIESRFVEMKQRDFSHEVIHEYRESIRRFRALLFFYGPWISATDYANLDSMSKRNFGHTSLIRELDVFEEGYGHLMLPKTLDRLQNIKRPLKMELEENWDRMASSSLTNIEIRMKTAMEDVNYKEWEHMRQAELYEEFISRSAYDGENVEKSIHAKRMRAKKLLYIHQMLMPDDKALVSLNALLSDFQLTAKNLHDVCVNLRFIGQYELDDAELISRLIQDHTNHLKASDDVFGSVRKAVENYLAF